MPFATIPNEIVLKIADLLPSQDLNNLSRTNHPLGHLLTPLLLRRAEQDDVERCIKLDFPASLCSILRPPATRLTMDFTIRVPCREVRADRRGMHCSRQERHYDVRPLHYAARHCSPELVAAIISLGAPVDEPDRGNTETRVTTLQCAVLSRNLLTVAHVLAAGADIDRASAHNRRTPLVLGCAINDAPIAHLLIDRGAQLGANALVMAAYSGLLDVLERILDMGVPVDALYITPGNWRGSTALQHVSWALPSRGTGAAELLLRKGADPNAGIGGDDLPLLRCARSNNLALARVLLDAGAEPNPDWGGKALATWLKETGVIRC